jgi:hypothetical protein
VKFFLLNALGDITKVDYCFTDNGPEPVMDDYDLSVGVRVADEYPDGIGDVTLQLGEDYPGLTLPSFIGNTDQMLIVSSEALGIMRRHELGEVEVIPFELINHKGRVHSRDYVFLNPIGTVDCLDMSRTECVLHDDGTIMKITKYVLASAKLAGLPQLFRPREMSDAYIWGQAVVDDLRQHGCTNFLFEELEQS